MKSGIYVIYNIITNWSYVGKSKNLDRRLPRHKRDLKNNCHYNRRLQNSYNKHGVDKFIYKILEFCDISMLRSREQYWLNLHKPNVYNARLDVLNDSHVGTTGIYHTEETKRLLTLKAGKLTEEQVWNIVADIKEGKWLYKEIAQRHNVAEHQVGNIARGRNWTNITGGAILDIPSNQHAEISKIRRAESVRKLSDAEIYQIFELLKQGLNYTEIGKQFNIGRSAIMQIATNQSYIHIKRTALREEVHHITIDEVKEIIKIFEEDINFPRQELAEKYGVSRNTIDRIIYTETYIELPRKFNIIRPILVETNRILTDEQVIEIIEMLQKNMTYKNISEEFNINIGIIKNINLGKTYKHIERSIPVRTIKPKPIYENNLEKDQLEIVIQHLKEAKISVAKIAELFNVSKNYIYQIKKENNITERYIYRAPRKISDDKINEIINLLKEGNLSQAEIAKQFNVRRGYVAKIKIKFQPLKSLF